MASKTPTTTTPTTAPSSSSSSTDTRAFELTQLQQRFNCAVTAAPHQLLITLKPSDPDFVYALDTLRLRLSAPPHTPPSIQVLNTDIPAGFRTNIERGFAELAADGGTLLQLVNRLDRRLEQILAGEKAETVTIVPNFAPPSPPPPPPEKNKTLAPSPSPLLERKVEVEVVVTSEQRAAAAARRAREAAQLESRLKLSGVFARSADGIEYVVPLEARRKDLLPVPLLSVRSVRLVVPREYDVQPARIEVADVPRDVASRVERKFAEFMRGNREVSLTGVLNILSARMHLWAAEEKEEPVEKIEAVRREQEEEVVVVVGEASEEGKGMKEDVLDKSHIKVIPRPPEWSFPDAHDGNDYGGNDEDDYSDFEGQSGDEMEEAYDKEAAAAAADGTPHSVQERGTSLLCPGIQMPDIELLEVLTLNVNIKCARCKSEKEVMNLHGTPPGMPGKPQAFRCEKCSEILGIGFRKDFIHQNSHRLGFFDLTGCSVAEILPSSFTPQCICSIPLPAPGLKDVVRGESVSATCRECHRKMGLYIPEFKLLRITHGGNLNLEKLPAKKEKEKERYVAGTELPYKGRCKHYRKSTRWFRFSCCSKVFPCDKCHDDAENHHSEHANRMICGLCSREQNYRPEDCRFCGNSFTSKKLSHYWEGGKGTRDQRLMSRNDPRKHKRIGKSVAAE